MAPISTGRAIVPPRPRVGDVFSDLGGVDRWAVYTLFFLAILLTFSVAFTSWQQKQNADQHHELIARIEQQDRDLRCYADHTRAFELAATEVLISQQKVNDPIGGTLRRRFDEVRDQLIRADYTCGPASAPPTTR
jgi:hypothetical protein